MKYVAVKVCIAKYPSVERERAAYAHIRKSCLPSTYSSDRGVVRISIDEFELSGSEGPHRCFVFEPLGLDLIHTREILGSLFSETVFKTVAVHVLRSIDLLHSQACMAHGGASFVRMLRAPLIEYLFRYTCRELFLEHC